MNEIKSYRDLQVWQLGKELAVSIYKTTSVFPKEEMYGIVSQMRRAAVSIPSNIAEGHSRHSTKDYIHFISIAIGSLAELETQLTICCELQFLNQDAAAQLQQIIVLLQKKLHTLRTKLKNQSPIPTPQSPS